MGTRLSYLMTMTGPEARTSSLPVSRYASIWRAPDIAGLFTDEWICVFYKIKGSKSFLFFKHVYR